MEVQQAKAKIKVLHIVQAAGLGGAVRAMFGIVKYLGPQYSHQLLSLAPHQIDPAAIALAAEHGISHIAAGDLSQTKQLIEAADLVHVHWWNNPELGCFLLEDLPAARYIGWFHVGGHDAPQAVTREAVEFFDAAVACSPYTLESPGFASAKVDETKKHFMVYGAADFARVATAQAKPHSGFNVGYVGTIDFLKMHPNYVAMSAEVRIPALKFIVCGSGVAEPVLRQQALERGVTDRFDIRGYVHDVASVFEQLDVYGYPLCEDTYAAAELNLQEAMFCGIPPVVFPYGGVKRLVMNEYTGLVVNTQREYKEAIEFFYHNPAERARIGKNAAEYARQIFGSENAAKKFETIYEWLLKQPKRARKWNMARSMELMKRTVLYGVDRRRTTGTSRFVATLGEQATAFEQSLTSSDDKVLLLAERDIARSSVLMKTSGIAQYERYYRGEPYLHLWAGLIAKKPEEAVLHFSEAFNHGLVHWRIVRYLARALAEGGNVELSATLMVKAKEMAPGNTIIELQD